MISPLCLYTLNFSDKLPLPGIYCIPTLAFDLSNKYISISPDCKEKWIFLKKDMYTLHSVGCLKDRTFRFMMYSKSCEDIKTFAELVSNELKFNLLSHIEFIHNAIPNLDINKLILNLDDLSKTGLI